MAASASPATQAAATEALASADTAAACLSVLYCLRADTQDVLAAGVVGPDGAEIASIRSEDAPPFSTARIAALTNAMAEIGLAVAQETELGICRSLILDADDGRTLILAVPAGRRFFRLFVTAGKGALLGQLVLHARECQDSLAEILEVEETATERAARASA